MILSVGYCENMSSNSFNPSIDPKQCQNDSFGPMLVKNDFLVITMWDQQLEYATLDVSLGN